MDYLGREFDNTMKIEVLPIRELLNLEARWDFVHMDVQGEEAKICQAAIGLLNERVHWLVVGTHSRLIEAELLEMLSRSHWELENEKPARFEFRKGAQSWESLTHHDGTQVWRNPRLDSPS